MRKTQAPKFTPLDTCIRLFSQFGPMLAALPLREALRHYFLGGVEWGETEIGLARFFGKAAYQGDPMLADRVVRPIADVMRGMMTAILTQATERGEIRADVDLEATTRALNALMIAVGDAQLFPYLNTYLQVSDVEMPIERVVDALLEMVLRGTT